MPFRNGVALFRRRRGRPGAAGLQGNFYPESASLAGDAVDANPSAHHLNQAFGDGETQTRAAVAPRGGGFRLSEAFKDACAGLLSQSDAGVADFDAQAGQDVQLHAAHLGELDGVREQVEQHLAQPARVSRKVGGHILLHEGEEVQVFAMGRVGNQVHGFLDQGSDIEVDGFEHQLAGVDLGEIEDIVDDREQRLATVSGHHTPETLGRELRKYRAPKDLPTMLYHIKPVFQAEVERECAALEGLNLHVLELRDHFVL